MRKLDKGAMFPKNNIVGDTKMMRDRIITSIPLLSFAIAKKTTKSRLRLKEQNRQNRRSEGGDSLKVIQKGAHMEFDFR